MTAECRPAAASSALSVFSVVQKKSTVILSKAKNPVNAGLSTRPPGFSPGPESHRFLCALCVHCGAKKSTVILSKAKNPVNAGLSTRPSGFSPNPESHRFLCALRVLRGAKKAPSF
jgi:hypothetical protein